MILHLSKIERQFLNIQKNTEILSLLLKDIVNYNIDKKMKNFDAILDFNVESSKVVINEIKIDAIFKYVENINKKMKSLDIKKSYLPYRQCFDKVNDIESLNDDVRILKDIFNYYINKPFLRDYLIGRLSGLLVNDNGYNAGDLDEEISIINDQ